MYANSIHKTEELKLILQNADVVAITEFRCNVDIADSERCLGGYVLYRADWKSGRKGDGVLLYVEDGFKSRLKDKLCKGEFEDSVWCNVAIGVSSRIIGVCYRSPSSSDDNNNASLKCSTNSRRQGNFDHRRL